MDVALASIEWHKSFSDKNKANINFRYLLEDNLKEKCEWVDAMLFEDFFNEEKADFNCDYEVEDERITLGSKF